MNQPHHHQLATVGDGGGFTLAADRQWKVLRGSEEERSDNDNQNPKP